MKWLSESKNGFVKVSAANGFVLSIKYLPPEYLALNELSKDDNNGDKTYNDYLELFNKSRTFLLTINHEEESVDASKYGVFNLAEYSQRIKDLSFNIKDVIFLKTSSGHKYNPVLTTMENMYEIRNKKSIYMVFSDDQGEILNSEKLDIVFQDIFLDTGISHFVFDKKKIDQLPNLNFLNK
ncbi:hypothetical protein N7U66_03485 [Lacinutrix neustonica]|uniref:Uncharacterized protein n=1 Tax=Lacinutrix neustonica TaxID=2980107 RepID=A0A9E8SEI5_9FLAO|nr:hypothetical protein [Lacinutrix neustonica]WAC02747.1 hypothetical protein N7U66_03485 [Lacinutrix neustonica]